MIPSTLSIINGVLNPRRKKLIRPFTSESKTVFYFMHSIIGIILKEMQKPFLSKNYLPSLNGTMEVSVYLIKINWLIPGSNVFIVRSRHCKDMQYFGS